MSSQDQGLFMLNDVENLDFGLALEPTFSTFIAAFVMACFL